MEDGHKLGRTRNLCKTTPHSSISVPKDDVWDSSPVPDIHFDGAMSCHWAIVSMMSSVSKSRFMTVLRG